MIPLDEEIPTPLVAWVLVRRWPETVWQPGLDDKGRKVSRPTTRYWLVFEARNSNRRPRTFLATEESVAEVAPSHSAADRLSVVGKIHTPGTMGQIRAMLREGDRA